MRRMVLIIVIVALCTIVAICGNITFVLSNGVLKKNKPAQTVTSDTRVLVDLTAGKLYLTDKSKSLKSYPVYPGKDAVPAPLGVWKIVKMSKLDKQFGSFWMGLNVPWGKYGIHASKSADKAASINVAGSIVMKDQDAEELYNSVQEGVPVRIYGGPYGPFGKGMRTLHPGDRGADVYEVEMNLKSQGYFTGKVNGIYDSSLKKAVRIFEKKKRLKLTYDLGKSFYQKLGIIIME